MINITMPVGLILHVELLLFDCHAWYTVVSTTVCDWE